MATLEIGWEKIPENGWELNPRSQLVSRPKNSAMYSGNLNSMQLPAYFV
jgi:hypothetical protein